MKDRIHSAEIVLPCADLNRSLEFFVEKIGFRVEMIFPADSPSVAVVSGYGLNLRIENSAESLPMTIRIVGDFSAETSREIFSPDGVRVILIDEKTEIEIPEAVQEFVVSTSEAENSWSEGRAGMLYRDLIPSRLGGRFIASHISIPAGGEVPDYVHLHKIRFQMIYCISGWAKLVYENQGEPFLMQAGDCVLQPPEIRHRVLETSDKFEVLEIGCPAVHETFADHQLNLPNKHIDLDRIFGGQKFVHHSAEKTSWKNSEIENLESLDSGIKTATVNLADVCTFRAVAETEFPVKHSGEFLFFFILEGNLELKGKNTVYDLKKADCFVLPNNTEYSIKAEKDLKMVRVSLGI